MLSCERVVSASSDAGHHHVRVEVEVHHLGEPALHRREGDVDVRGGHRVDRLLGGLERGGRSGWSALALAGGVEALTELVQLVDVPAERGLVLRRQLGVRPHRVEVALHQVDGRGAGTQPARRHGVRARQVGEEEIEGRARVEPWLLLEPPRAALLVRARPAAVAGVVDGEVERRLGDRPRQLRRDELIDARRQRRLAHPGVEIVPRRGRRRGVEAGEARHRRVPRLVGEVIDVAQEQHLAAVGVEARVEDGGDGPADGRERELPHVGLDQLGGREHRVGGVPVLPEVAVGDSPGEEGALHRRGLGARERGQKGNRQRQPAGPDEEGTALEQIGSSHRGLRAS